LKTKYSFQSTPNPTALCVNPLLAFCATYWVSSNTFHSGKTNSILHISSYKSEFSHSPSKRV
jgi:hypothetical protein